MIVGTAFTLFVVPSIYMLVAKTRTAQAAERAGEREEEVTLPGVPEPAG